MSSAERGRVDGGHRPGPYGEYFLACFGCGEIEYLLEGKTTRYDMGELREPMTEALKEFRLKRPVPKAER